MSKCAYSIYRREGNECVLYPQNLVTLGYSDTDDLIVRNGSTVCDIGWHQHGSHCYWFPTTRKTWFHAVNSCHKMGAILAEPIYGDAEQYLAQNAISKGTRFWYGFNDLQQESTFLLESTKELVTYFNWYPGEPNNDNNKEHCLLNNYHKRFDFTEKDVLLLVVANQLYALI